MLTVIQAGLFLSGEAVPHSDSIERLGHLTVLCPDRGSWEPHASQHLTFFQYSHIGSAISGDRPHRRDGPSSGGRVCSALLKVHRAVFTTSALLSVAESAVLHPPFAA